MDILIVLILSSLPLALWEGLRRCVKNEVYLYKIRSMGFDPCVFILKALASVSATLWKWEVNASYRYSWCIGLQNPETCVFLSCFIFWQCVCIPMHACMHAHMFVFFLCLDIIIGSCWGQRHWTLDSLELGLMVIVNQLPNVGFGNWTQSPSQ